MKTQPILKAKKWFLCFTCRVSSGQQPRRRPVFANLRKNRFGVLSFYVIFLATCVGRYQQVLISRILKRWKRLTFGCLICWWDRTVKVKVADSKPVNRSRLPWPSSVRIGQQRQPSEGVSANKVFSTINHITINLITINLTIIPLSTISLTTIKLSTASDNATASEGASGLSTKLYDPPTAGTSATMFNNNQLKSLMTPIRKSKPPPEEGVVDAWYSRPRPTLLPCEGPPPCNGSSCTSKFDHDYHHVPQNLRIIFIMYRKIWG